MALRKLARNEKPHQPKPVGAIHCQYRLNTVLTDITNLLSLRDGLVAGLKLVAQQMLLRQRVKPLELVIGRRKGCCLEQILSQNQ